MIPQEGKVLVDFYADWCGPCKMLGRVIEDVEADFQTRGINIVKVNIDEHGEYAQQMGIRGVPTLILFNNGSELARRSGMLNETQLRDFAGAKQLNG